jgi:N-acetylmuramic acid 6-phosphate etherase
MAPYEELIRQLRALGTEQVNPRTADIDRLSPLEIVRKINDEDATVAEVVRKALPEIAQAAEWYAETLRGGGRVFYIGAGTSGRLGVLDAAECPPTFGTQPEQIIGLIAGGYDSLMLSKEGAEDKRDDAVKALKEHGLTRHDLVIGIAASRRTPYTIAGLEYGQSVGARAVFIICNTGDSLEIHPDLLIALPVGPEAITGSTRMKSGTAQKMTLNLISTTAMVLLGKTYGNLMVDLLARSEKLAARSRKILMDVYNLSAVDADQLLRNADGSVKTAIVMHMKSCTKDEALRMLSLAEGFIARIA